MKSKLDIVRELGEQHEKEIRELEEELHQLKRENTSLKEQISRLSGEVTSTASSTTPVNSTMLEKEVSSMILISHMENTRQIYELQEELKQKELDYDQIIIQQQEKLQEVKNTLSLFIKMIRSMMNT